MKIFDRIGNNFGIKKDTVNLGYIMAQSMKTDLEKLSEHSVVKPEPLVELELCEITEVIINYIPSYILKPFGSEDTD